MWEVLFSFESSSAGPGTIFVADDTPSGLQFIDTGVLWAKGPYKELRVQTDPVADSINYYYDNSLIYTSTSGMFGATVTEQLVILDDNFQLAGETGDFDNLSIASVPEPAISSLLLLGAATCTARRRR